MTRYFTPFLEALCLSDLVRSRLRYLFFFLIIVLNFSCKKEESDLITLLHEKYANLHVNNPAAKKAALIEITNFLKTHPLNEDSIHEVRQKLHRLRDGHVVLYKNKKEIFEGHGKSPLHFKTGSQLIEECPECIPPLKAGLYQIEKVEDMQLEKWFEVVADLVPASTIHARNYRAVRILLGEHLYKAQVNLVLKDQKNRLYHTHLFAQRNSNGYQHDCIEGVHIEENIFQLKIKTFWCDQGNPALDREKVYKNFEAQWNRTIQLIRPEDKIILDLRENGGGGDWEVMLVANTFFGKSVFMDEYQYLESTRPGWKKFITQKFPGLFPLWAKRREEYVLQTYKPSHFLNQFVITLISPGCFSSCETIAAIMKFEKRSKLIGETTHGGSGDPVLYPIKGTDYSVSLPACLVWKKDGTLFEGEGVKPDMLIDHNNLNSDNDSLQSAISLMH